MHPRVRSRRMPRFEQVFVLPLVDHARRVPRSTRRYRDATKSSPCIYPSVTTQPVRSSANSLVPPTSGSTKPRRSPSCRGFVASGPGPAGKRRGRGLEHADWLGSHAVGAGTRGVSRAGPSVPPTAPSTRGPSPSSSRPRGTWPKRPPTRWPVPTDPG